ncbi:MAG: HAD-IA family hydrolase [Leptospiraceae bacterium]|nr:HAD-IA family hydrolase [Leptospiraceae bacterium]
MENQYIYLDIGDTVLHLKKSPGEIYLDLIDSFGIDVGGIESSTANKAFYEAWNFLDQKYQRKDFKDRYSYHPEGSRGFWMDLIKRFLSSLDLPESDSLKVSIFESFETGQHWMLEPSFMDLVKVSHLLGIRMGVLSNWDNRLRSLLKKIGIHDYFDDFIISGEIGYEKPSKEIFKAAEKKVGLSGGSILYVGDKLALDWLPASELGWKAFLFVPEWKSKNPQFKKNWEENLPEGCDIISKLNTILGNQLNSIDAKAP